MRLIDELLKIKPILRITESGYPVTHKNAVVNHSWILTSAFDTWECEICGFVIDYHASTGELTVYDAISDCNQLVMEQMCQ